MGNESSVDGIAPCIPLKKGSVPIASLYVLSREEAIAQWIHRRYGRGRNSGLLPAMLQQHHTFDLAA